MLTKEHRFLIAVDLWLGNICAYSISSIMIKLFIVPKKWPLLIRRTSTSLQSVTTE